MSRVKAGKHALLLLATTIAWSCVQGQAVGPATGLEEAQGLRARAKAMKEAAGRQFDREAAECRQRTFPNSCVEEAKERKREALHASRDLDAKGREGERAARRLEHETKAARRAQEAPRAEEEERQRSESFRQARERRDAERSAKSQKEAADSLQSLSKAQAEEVALRKKRDDLARAEVEKDRLRSARASAERERQSAIAEHAAKIDERIRERTQDKAKREADAAAKRATEAAAKEKLDKRGSASCEFLPRFLCRDGAPGK